MHAALCDLAPGQPVRNVRGRWGQRMVHEMGLQPAPSLEGHSPTEAGINHHTILMVFLVDKSCWLRAQHDFAKCARFRQGSLDFPVGSCSFPVDSPPKRNGRFWRSEKAFGNRGALVQRPARGPFPLERAAAATPGPSATGSCPGPGGVSQALSGTTGKYLRMSRKGSSFGGNKGILGTLCQVWTLG